MTRTSSSYSSGSSNKQWSSKTSNSSTFSFIKCFLILLPLAIFLLLGVYLVLVDLEIVSSVINLGDLDKKNTSEIHWSDVPVIQDVTNMEEDEEETVTVDTTTRNRIANKSINNVNQFVLNPDLFYNDYTTETQNLTEIPIYSNKNTTGDKISYRLNINNQTSDNFTDNSPSGDESIYRLTTNNQTFDNFTANLQTGDKFLVNETQTQRNLSPNHKLVNRTVILLQNVQNNTRFSLFHRETQLNKSLPEERKNFTSSKEFLKVVKAPDFSNNTSGVTFGPIVVKNMSGGGGGNTKVIITDDPVYGVRKSVLTRPHTTPIYPLRYNPTVPAFQVQPKFEITTQQVAEDTCFSTKLKFCEGILPYDLVQLPDIPNVHNYEQLRSILPYFQLILSSNCSHRIREFLCVVLEPQCQVAGHSPTPPCRANCKVLVEQCKDYVLETLDLSRVFDCRRYPDWNTNTDCLNLAKGSCLTNEFRCPDGTCIPEKWVCDGVNDCPGVRPAADEIRCEGCAEHEFRCVMDGKCVPKTWTCDGSVDCLDESDEATC